MVWKLNWFWIARKIRSIFWIDQNIQLIFWIDKNIRLIFRIDRRNMIDFLNQYILFRWVFRGDFLPRKHFIIRLQLFSYFCRIYIAKPVSFQRLFSKSFLLTFAALCCTVSTTFFQILHATFAFSCTTFLRVLQVTLKAIGVRSKSSLGGLNYFAILPLIYWQIEIGTQV